MSAPAAVAVPDAERLARAGLARVLEPGRRDVWAAVAEHGAEAVWQAVAGDGPAPRISPGVLEGARLRARGYSPARDLEALARVGGRLVCPGDAEWPADRVWWTPEAMPDAPPLALHVRGQAALGATVERSVAVVGARAATAYGTLVAGELGCGLADRGWTVVSGAAYGIDAAAHEGALTSGRAPTLAVLACGLDRAYPAGHDRLLARIARTGLVVSEVPVGSAPTRSRFLVRNRLIAALSKATVAVEAAARSGSLATVDRARALGRRWMAVPGPVTSTMSAGTHQLLREGADCVTSAADVLSLVGPLDAAGGEPVAGEHRPRDDLSDVARQVLDAVPVRRAAGVGGIAKAAGVSVLVVQQVLPPLVLHGLVERTPDGWRLTALGSGRPAPAPG